MGAKHEGTEPDRLERKVTEENPKVFTKDRIRPVAKEESELKITIDIETKKALEKLKDILSQKMGQEANLRNAVKSLRLLKRFNVLSQISERVGIICTASPSKSS